ncbi:hypothetical protein C1H46_014286 [Malus baccata]|uniref:Piwi domain-containing protein n=1 Tax=Malus baccata TaxID=106549 RepID=A0A540MMU6_MALBA|nr:hypothetical protein C1H46_014286 [Malus baccata]
MDSFEPDGNGVNGANGVNGENGVNGTNGMNGANGAEDALPPPPPVIPPDVVPLRAEADKIPEPVKKKPARAPIARRGQGTKGTKIPLVTNHFKVNVTNIEGYFFHYSVSVAYEDGRPLDGKGAGRRIIERVHETYQSELGGKDFAYDGEKSLFTVGSLPRNKLEFAVVLEDVPSSRNNGTSEPDGPGSPNESDRKRLRRPNRSKTFNVEISYAAKIPMKAIGDALRGQESENSQEALRVLDIILRQHASKQGCLLVRQSFFHNDPKNFADVGGGVLGCRGFHSSFRTTQGGLSLNIDVSTTMIIQPGPVVDFLIANQNVRDPFQLDWTKEGEDAEIEVTVYDYFVNHRNIQLRYSADLPCLNVGKPKRPTYIPLELCSLVSLQRYTKALSTLQRASLVEKSRQKPQERMSVLSNVGPWKRKNLAEYGIVTQCIAPTRVNDQYLTNVLLKINAKLGGLNSLLAVEYSPSIPVVSKAPTIILGMDVSHGSPGQSDVPSIAAVVSSRQWPLISRYRASVRTQSPKVEMIDSLYKRVSDTEDDGIMRDGVSESQFNQVLNIELDQIIEACKFLDENWSPKFVVIIAQKNHHTKFFQPQSPDNVPPGTIIDNRICHPRNNDFYLCAQAGMIGTTRPTHYHVLLDDVGFSADDLQELVHSLSYVYQRSTTAISVVAPICYAHLAATQMSQFMKFEDASETSSSHGGLTSAGAVPVPQLPRLKENVSNSMFFC